mmetsp:Transcript_79056/g.228562  ORF Transcript_79056/g.228562 Transcript_79056/m.228562 type:complete len:352 (+) Transcript_79056:52-1107(+)
MGRAAASSRAATSATLYRLPPGSAPRRLSALLAFLGVGLGYRPLTSDGRLRADGVYQPGFEEHEDSGSMNKRAMYIPTDVRKPFGSKRGTDGRVECRQPDCFPEEEEAEMKKEQEHGDDDDTVETDQEAEDDNEGELGLFPAGENVGLEDLAWEAVAPDTAQISQDTELEEQATAVASRTIGGYDACDMAFNAWRTEVDGLRFGGAQCMTLPEVRATIPFGRSLQDGLPRRQWRLEAGRETLFLTTTQSMKRGTPSLNCRLSPSSHGPWLTFSLRPRNKLFNLARVDLSRCFPRDEETRARLIHGMEKSGRRDVRFYRALGISVFVQEAPSLAYLCIHWPQWTSRRLAPAE